jgi:hypothetical protein
MRDEFEKAFPVPDGVYWHEGHGRYLHTAYFVIGAMIAHQHAWQAWQAATALQDQRVRELEYSSGQRGVMLMMIREILNVLPDDCLGTGSMRDCAPYPIYPIKAEVIDGIGKALSATAREVGE